MPPLRALPGARLEMGGRNGARAGTVTAMEMELARHDWAAFTGRGSDTAQLPGYIRRLFTTTDPQEATHVGQFIAHCASGDQLLADASPAIAAALVHGIWTCSGPGRDTALDILADLAGAQVSDVEPDAYGVVSEADCMVEIVRGLPVYAEVLEHGDGPVLGACIDLIYVCGLADPWTRDRARFYLRTVLGLPRFVGYRDLLNNCLAELDAADQPPSAAVTAGSPDQRPGDPATAGRG